MIIKAIITKKQQSPWLENLIKTQNQEILSILFSSQTNK